MNIINHVNMFNSFPILNLFCFAQICENPENYEKHHFLNLQPLGCSPGVVPQLSSFRSSRIYHFCLTRSTPIFIIFWANCPKIPYNSQSPEWSGYFWRNNMEYPYSTHHFRGDQPVTWGRYSFCPNNLSLTLENLQWFLGFQGTRVDIPTNW